MRAKALLLVSIQSSGNTVSEMAEVSVRGTITTVTMANWRLMSFAATGALPLFDSQNKLYLYDTIKLGSYGPYSRTQTTEIHQACSALSGTSVLCTITGVRPIES